MRTSKHISNIAYLKPEDFSSAVERLQKTGVISSCLWVCHKGEKGEKDHIHFLLLGGQRTYDTKGLHEVFGFSLYPDGSKGSVTKLWCPTKRVEDWLLYSVHDKKYLLKKMETKEHYYTMQDIQCTDGDRDTLSELIRISEEYRDNDMDDKVYKAVRFAVQNNMEWKDVIVSGLIPVNVLGGAYQVYETMLELNRKKKNEKKLNSPLRIL